ncbi:DNA polymerase III subunit beta family protein [Streptomyces griseus]|uniref:DNA polymerase III subunit beta family protein n=1 Tax=Streptomyces griseus TaxID=1911 RepID=UPI00369A4011
MTTINAHKLQRLIKQTRNHISPDDTLPPINGIRFECDGVHIHALATDRYTFAVARTKVREETDTWTVTISEKTLGWLTPWLKTHKGDTILNLSVTADGLTITDDDGKLTVPITETTFPKWQHLFRDALQDASTSGDLVSVDTDMLSRWKHADTHLRVWQTGAEKPLLLIGEEFLGLQMPCRYSGDNKDRAEVIGEWMGSLAKKKGENAETVAPLPQPGAVTKMAEEMLRQTLRSTGEMFGANMDTVKGRGAFNAWVHSGIYAWSAYRLLQALKQADPDLAEQTVRDLSEQLESGEIGEWAWDEAEAAGHDPQKWSDDYEAHLKKVAEKAAAEQSST